MPFTLTKTNHTSKDQAIFLVSSGRTCSVRLVYFLFISWVVILVLQLSLLYLLLHNQALLQV